MLSQNGLPRVRSRARERIALEVVDSSDARGLLVLPGPDGSVLFRGQGNADYACGRCGHLLAIGIRRGMFQRFAFACACGAVNQVIAWPSDQGA